MQVCKNCGKPVHYIATGHDIVIECNAERIRILTDSGHYVFGYTEHQCEAEKADDKKD